MFRTESQTALSCLRLSAPPVNSMDFSGKDTVLDVVRTDTADFSIIMDDPQNWNVQTRCTEWEVRDVVGHMVDMTEGYLSRWDSARKGEPRDIAGLLVMGESLNTFDPSDFVLTSFQRFDGGTARGD